MAFKINEHMNSYDGQQQQKQKTAQDAHKEQMALEKVQKNELAGEFQEIKKILKEQTKDLPQNYDALILDDISLRTVLVFSIVKAMRYDSAEAFKKLNAWQQVEKISKEVSHIRFLPGSEHGKIKAEVYIDTKKPSYTKEVSFSENYEDFIGDVCGYYLKEIFPVQ